jgi:hypothetical protein
MASLEGQDTMPHSRESEIQNGHIHFVHKAVAVVVTADLMTDFNRVSFE